MNTDTITPVVGIEVEATFDVVLPEPIHCPAGFSSGINARKASVEAVRVTVSVGDKGSARVTLTSVGACRYVKQDGRVGLATADNRGIRVAFRDLQPEVREAIRAARDKYAVPGLTEAVHVLARAEVTPLI